MARRSPMNERYQKNTAPAGKTRKSAAAAKPKRHAASSATSKSSAGKPAEKRKLMAVNPPTPEFRFWRRIWWALLITAMLLSVGTWFLYRDPDLRKIGQYGLLVSYAFIGAALWLDMTKLRRMRQAWVQSGGNPEKTEDKS